MSAVDETRWLTKAEIAEHLRCSESTIDRLVGRGLPSVKLGEERQAHRRFDRAAVDDWIREHGNGEEPNGGA